MSEICQYRKKTLRLIHSIPKLLRVGGIDELIVDCFDGNFKYIYQILQRIRDEEIYISELACIFEIVRNIKRFNCLNISEKFSDVTNFDKLLSLKSELVFALEFLKEGFDVTMIRDSDSGNLPSPDFWVKKQDLKIIIEVAKIGGYGTINDNLKKIRSSISDINLKIWIRFSKDLSRPVMTSKEHNERDEKIDKLISCLKTRLSQINDDDLQYDNFQEFEICGCRFDVRKTFDSCGSFDGMASPILIPIDDLNLYLKNIIQKKTGKRERWDNDYRNFPYLIALDIQQETVFHRSLLSFLLGQETQYDKSMKLPTYMEPSLVSQAKAEGWLDLLEKVGYNSQSFNCIQEPGLFLSDICVCKNMTGLVARIWNQFQFVPNPFAERSINCPSIQSLIPWDLCPSDDDSIE